MDISKARRLVELEKEGRKILVTLWEGEQITTCATSEEANKQHCETCQGDDELCSSYIDYLKTKGYQATEIELTEAVEETLPKFLEERKIADKVESVPETEVIEHAEVGTVEAVLGSPEELQPGESGSGSPETS